MIELAEELVARLWSEIAGYQVPRPIPRMTYAEAMRRFGSDKPDLRFGCELTDLTGFFAETGFGVFQAPHVGAVVMPGGAVADPAGAGRLAGLGPLARRPRPGLRAHRRRRERSPRPARSPGTCPRPSGPGCRPRSARRRATAVFFAAGTPDAARSLLGAARLEIGNRCGLIDRSAWAFTWVVDAPMFEEDGSGGWTAVHHPFTAPLPEWADKFADSPESALADAYDIVCNGNEIGGGSIRIHRADMQRKVFDVIGLSAEEAASQFGFLLEAFKYGPPPHGGIAFGWDRVMALLAGKDTIRDVIAFPKAASGLDPLTGAPTPITPEQRREAGIDVILPRPAPRPSLR